MRRFEFVEQPNRKNPSLVIEGAKIDFTNFEGREERNQEGRIVNSSGNRKFSVLIDDEELAQQLINDPYPYKIYIRKPKEEGDTPKYYLNVGVSNRFFEPVITKVCNDGTRTTFAWDLIDLIDHEDILEANMFLQISPGINQQTGAPQTKCYLERLDFSAYERRFDYDLATREYPQE